MFRISRFHEVMKGLPRGRFMRLVEDHGSDKFTKRFQSWNQLVAMVYGQLAGAESLRTLEAGFNSQRTHHYHLGCSEIHRSTLSEANGRRATTVFAAAAHGLMARLSEQDRQRVKAEGLKDLLVALDSTSITLEGRGFDNWTAEQKTRTRGLKLHVEYAVADQVPISQTITATNVNDISEAVKLVLVAGTIYVFDKGYCNYNWWYEIDQAMARFVTRFKSNAGLKVECTRPILAEAAGLILSDEIVRFKYKSQSGGRRNAYQKPLRRISVQRPGHKDPLVLATNDLASSAQQIAEYYKQRWQIELFFKWIKQHLKIKRFLGRSENAVRLQILTALITYLLLAIHHKSAALTGSLWLALSELRATLFQRPGIDDHYRRERKRQALQFTQMQPSLFA